MGISLRIQLNENLYLRDPEQTELGRKIIDDSIKLIDLLGFEKFTFKKLATEIKSTEASVYRYFENKHKLLIYLVSWYWRWVEYMIDYQTHNIDDSKKRLKIILGVLADSIKDDPTFSHVDEEALHRIVVEESAKAYHTKEVDHENEVGLFKGYKNLVGKIAEVIHEVNPNYPFARALACTTIEASQNQIFFAEHLPKLTEVKVGKEDTSQVQIFLEDFVFKAIV